jgi:hypothetical protein
MNAHLASQQAIAVSQSATFSVDWFRPVIHNAARFPDGFTTNLSIVGSSYHVPGHLKRILELADDADNGSFTATDDGLANPFVRTLIARNNSVLIVNPAPSGSGFYSARKPGYSAAALSVPKL